MKNECFWTCSVLFYHNKLNRKHRKGHELIDLDAPPPPPLIASIIGDLLVMLLQWRMCHGVTERTMSITSHVAGNISL